MTCDLQFGFKEGLSAGLATSVFLETTDYYVRKGGNVYALALDASKALPLHVLGQAQLSIAQVLFMVGLTTSSSCVVVDGGHGQHR